MIRLQVLCNKCGVVGAETNNFAAHSIREKLKQNDGWAIITQGGEDYCRKCAEELKVVSVSPTMKRRDIKYHRCFHCGHSLHENEDATCPECGMYLVIRKVDAKCLDCGAVVTRVDCKNCGGYKSFILDAKE